MLVFWGRIHFLNFFFQVESLRAEAARECKAAQDSITTMYKLELMKMPKQVKEMSWEDYCAEVGETFAVKSLSLTRFSTT